MDDNIFFKILIALCLFGFYQFLMSWSQLNYVADNKLTLESQVETLTRKKENLERKILSLEREGFRLQMKLDRMTEQARDLLPLARKRVQLPTIFFITPTAFRPAQKADLTRLSQTLSHISNLHWIVVEDANESSSFIDQIIEHSKLLHVHLISATPPDMKLKDADPNWKFHRGVAQRNTALQWIRTNFADIPRGAVYFGDDDNTYDWRLFDEMRTINRVGVWPVGIVGGQLVETPNLNFNLTVNGFNSIWKANRPFPIDMAAFAVNVSLILAHPNAVFTYDIPLGYQESHFLTALNLTREDLEPKAEFCTKVYVWHTRTEKTPLSPDLLARFHAMTNLSDLELNAIQ